MLKKQSETWLGSLICSMNWMKNIMGNKRRHNPNRVKENHSYTIKEVAKVLGIHNRTVQSWRKQGLKVMDTNIRPYLIHGKELKRFIKDKTTKNTFKLKTGEFYCPKCKCPRFSVKDDLRIVLTNKRLGLLSIQALIKGKCKICNTTLTLFSSDKKLQEMKGKGMLLQELEVLLSGDRGGSLNADKERGI